jgi:choline dehydrogenase-like flavoprotein
VFETTDIQSAASRTWDVIVAGSSFSAMFFLGGLRSGLRVLVVEKGQVIDHDTQLSTRTRPQEVFAHENLSDHPKEWVAHTMFGGNSNCWWGQVPRFHPSDFRLFEDHGRAAPWPVDYAMLEPFYAEVEQVMEVAGGGTEEVFPRSAPYPHPPHALSLTDKACVAYRPDLWFPAPSARSNGGNRATCCANGVCRLCPVDAKFTILNSGKAFTRPDVTLVSGAEVVAVDIEGEVAKGVVVRDSAGRETALRADLVALGTNAIGNAAILLRSGVAHPALGRYLHEQASVALVLDVAHKGYFGGTSITAHCYGFYDGPHRSEAAAVLIETLNAPATVRPERGRWTDRMQVKLIAEEIPAAENTVTIDGADDIQLTWTGHSVYSRAGLTRAEAGLAEVLPFEIEDVVSRVVNTTEAHIQGTHRMGADPASSVVDGVMALHGVSNLFALGSGAFPTCSPANPTLTLSALALRAGRSV